MSLDRGRLQSWHKISIKLEMDIYSSGSGSGSGSESQDQDQDVRMSVRRKPVEKLMRKVENSHPKRDSLRPLCPQGDEQTGLKLILLCAQV